MPMVFTNARKADRTIIVAFEGVVEIVPYGAALGV